MKPVALPLFLSCMLAVAPALADEHVRTVTVDGRASLTATPDTAFVSMAVQARDLDLDAARGQVVDVTRSFLEFCDQQGFDSSNIRTTGISIQPQYRWDDRSQQQELQAYLVRRQLEVEVVDLDRLGTLIEGAADTGVNEVSPPRLASSRADELHREALAAAARDARANARVLAETLGASLGDVVDVTARRQSVPRPGPVMERVQLAAADGAAESYVAGDIRFEASVTARFELAEAN